MIAAKVWIEGARPKTLMAALSPVLIGTAIAYDQGHFHLLTFVFSLLFGVFIQIGTNFANDYLDFRKGADTKERKGPRRLAQSGLVPVKTLERATVLIFGCSALYALYLTWQGGWIIALLAALAVLFGYLYTAGPYPLGYIGLGDLFVLIFFGPVAVCGAAYLQTGEISPLSLLAGLPPGLISVAILTCNNVRDIEEDRLAGKRTLPVRFGLAFGQIQYALCLVLAALFPLFLVILTRKHPFSLFACATLVFAMPLIRSIFKEENHQELLPKTGKLLTLFTFLFIIGWLL